MTTNALIFAGGVGNRMNTLAKPKQFLQLYGKEIIFKINGKFFCRCGFSAAARSGKKNDFRIFFEKNMQSKFITPWSDNAFGSFPDLSSEVR